MSDQHVASTFLMSLRGNTNQDTLVKAATIDCLDIGLEDHLNY